MRDSQIWLQGPDEPEDPESTDRPVSSVRAFMMAALILLVLYPISLGPMAALINQNWCPRSLAAVLQFVYSPLLAFANLANPFSQFYRSYLDLWT